MADANLDGMLIFAQESMYWLTGYDTFGYCFFQCLVLKADGEMTLLTRSADLRQAQHTSNLKNIVIWKDGANANPSIDLKAVAADMSLQGKRLGVEYDCHGLTAMNGKKVDAAFDGFASLEDASPIIPRLREVKSDEEIAYIIKASESADRALDAAIKTTAAGVSEGEILAAMQGAIFLDDGDYAGNEFIIGSAEDALLCRYKSGRRTLSENDQLTLEWAGAHAHYHSAMMRTLIVGEPMKEHKHHFEAANGLCWRSKVPCRPETPLATYFPPMPE